MSEPAADAAAPAEHRPNPVWGLAKLVAAAAAYGAGSSAPAAGAGTSGDAHALDFRRPGAHDAHPFFSYYGMLVHQQNMMQDAVRAGAAASA